MANKTKEEILEEQRAEATAAYASKINELHLQEIEAEDKIKNLNKTLDDAFSKRKKEIDDLEIDLKDRIAHFDNKSAELSAIRKETELKLAEADNVLSKAKADASTHQANVNNHLNSVDEIKFILSNKSSELDERTIKVAKLESDVEIKFKTLEAKEKEIEEKISQLNNTSESVNSDINKQKELYEKNQAEIEKLKSLNIEVQASDNKNSEELANLIAIRDSLDLERKSQINRKLEISQREEELQQKNVKSALDLQRLQDKEKEINAQIAKLNEVKNNVESLMKLQEKGV